MVRERNKLKPLAKRFIASAAFLAGGVLFWFVLAGLHAFGAAEAGMSDGPVHAPSADALIPWLVCSYFAVSGIGVLFSKNRSQLKVVAGLAYLTLLIAFGAICSEGLGGGFDNLVGGILIIGGLTMLVFLPWHIVWCRLLFANTDDDANAKGDHQTTDC